MPGIWWSALFYLFSVTKWRICAFNSSELSIAFYMYVSFGANFIHKILIWFYYVHYGVLLIVSPVVKTPSFWHSETKHLYKFVYSKFQAAIHKYYVLFRFFNDGLMLTMQPQAWPAYTCRRFNPNHPIYYISWRRKVSPERTDVCL